MIVTLAMGLMVAQPASGPIAIGACARARTSAADRRAATVSVRSGGAPDQSVILRIADHVAACAPGEADPTEIEITSAIAQIAKVEIGGELAGHGLDPARIDGWFARRSESARLAIPTTAEEGNAVLQDMASSGLPRGPLDTHAVAVGNYVASLIVLERIRRGLSPVP